MEIKSSEFFRNIKRLPPGGTKEFSQLIEWEEQKILGGVTVGGVYFSGWLYWHLNHWWIRVDDVDEWGNDIRVPSLPDLRDNEWERAEFLEKCKRERKGYIEVGARQIGKDLLNSSILYMEDKEIEIGSCEMGDRIYGEDGELHTIIGKYPQGVRKVYEVELVDGRKIQCGLHHNWYVKHKGRMVKKTTQEMLDCKETKYYVPISSPVQYKERCLPVNPYIFGTLLVDAIPSEYLHSSIEQRTELLMGLMDTDGKVEKGTAVFPARSENFNSSFEFLCRSLGMMVRRDGDKYRLYTSRPVFKLKKWDIQVSEYEHFCPIVNIEYKYDAETTCIEVDGESHLFLTDGFTVTHNSDVEASYFGMNAIMFPNTQNVIVCGNDDDLSLMKDKVDFGMRKIWKGLAIPKLDKTWKLNQIRLGYKTVDGEDEVWSYIVIRNAREGNVTEVAAGTTAKTFIIDEIGKFPFASTYKAAEPALKGRMGLRNPPILVGTGGSFERGKDAENFFYNPESNSFAYTEDEKTGKKTGLFLSGLYRHDCKYVMPLSQWLIEEKGMELEDVSELSKLEIHVSDKELAKKTIDEERAAALKNPDPVLYLKQVMYYPLNIDECFLSSTQNIFNVEAARRQQNRLKEREFTGTPVVLYMDEHGKPRHEFTDKMPIKNYPIETGESKDAPVVIYEFPVENPPYGLYSAGIDSYRQGKAKYSDSLGAVYIYKRMHDLMGEKYQDMFVASYVARPPRKEDWEEQARLLIKMYNARALCENDDISFIEYMKAKGDARYLEKQPDWLKEIVPNSSVRREYGIHRSAGKIIDYLHACFKEYMEEIVFTDRDEEGNVISEVLGVYKILDAVLLEEVIKFDETKNVDRLVAAELAVAQAMRMDPILGRVGGGVDIAKIIYERSSKPALFSSSKRMFVNRRRKIFTN